ncbi:MAG: hypothetical protein EOO72_02375 [Myxococcaceae bacterium]|nr:MAG: hypothetical protein EOO72_02375 [Myxococcaceae bacterium]
MVTTPRWSDGEDLVVIGLYKRLLADELRGVTLDLNQEILRTSGVAKTAGAVRMRLQNVSALLERKGLPRIQHLSPLSNYPDQLERLVDASLPW